MVSMGLTLPYTLVEKAPKDEETGKDIQRTGMISDMELTAREITIPDRPGGRIKRLSWSSRWQSISVEYRIHDVPGNISIAMWRP